MGRESIRVTRSVSIDPDEIELRVSRSSGPGGQHANTSETRVEALFDVEGSPSLSEAQKRDYITKGLAMEDKALQLNPDYMEAMTYKNILLRLKANITKDPAEQKRLIEEADKLRNKVIDAQKRKQTGKG